MSEENFSHMDKDGSITMVDVGHKDDTRRTAIVRTVVEVSENTLNLLLEQALPKGDVLTTAKIAGIQAAKRTWELTPLCHPLFLSYVDVRFEINKEQHAIHIEAEARTTSQTGVEMEALTAVNVALLTVYDMCKAVEKGIVIENLCLVEKTGGKSGDWQR